MIKYVLNFVVLALISLFLSFNIQFFLQHQSQRKNTKEVLDKLETVKCALNFAANADIYDTENHVSIKKIQLFLINYYKHNLLIESSSILSNSTMLAMYDDKIISPFSIEENHYSSLIKANYNSLFSHPNKVHISTDMPRDQESIFLLLSPSNADVVFAVKCPLDYIMPAASNLKIYTNNIFGKESTLTIPKESGYINDFHLKVPPIKYLSIYNFDLNLLFLTFFPLLIIYCCFSYTYYSLKNKANHKLNTLTDIIDNSSSADIEKKVSQLKMSHDNFKTISYELRAKCKNIASQLEITQESSKAEIVLTNKIVETLQSRFKSVVKLVEEFQNTINESKASHICLSSYLTKIHNTLVDIVYLNSSTTVIPEACGLKKVIDDSLIIFSKALKDINCEVNISHIDETVILQTDGLILTQIMNGVMKRLLYSMDDSVNNKISIKANKNNDDVIITFTNTSLGIPIDSTEASPFSSNSLTTPDWVKTKALAKGLSIDIQEISKLSVGEEISLKFAYRRILQADYISHENVFPIY